MIDIIGNTPIIKLKTKSPHNIYAKCEWLNPTGSIKDRVAKYIINSLIETNKINKYTTLVEASSGNMGTSLAAIAKSLELPVHITCPAKTGLAKRNMIKSFGAKLTVCKNTADHQDKDFYVNKAREIANTPNAIFINQYDNPLNTECHYETTGREIVDYFATNQIDLDYFITVGGSGGTITGCSKRIKEFSPTTKVIMPDPKGSVYYDIFNTGQVIKENIQSYKVEGPGNPVFCKSMNLDYIDQVIQFTDEQAMQGCYDLANEQGIYAGHSSGANYHIAKQLLSLLPKDKNYNVLIMILDSGMKYNFN
ncbi:cysteine synthase family protein [Francisella adeliensis]|uniref:cysteine synthase n=1 Tax=Francisella adeliensis TaxID=2007306 RepID=A0A2Z4XZN9_9GAMM|nr:cysteine synthase family protein [Francisella adeliensis]AXA34347.1 cystathionine beta-synthase [Francisella adeliensis]MBK2084664.1 cysteine synthase family protein [Francisella adeliensis]MBK2096173.1 cysteine synthase family protein [Francisella adeliensis]QIW12594.1 cysteine synthase family protein [Francisella adeliensis]QIW14467.1 cysteine synthase family protein [Francisella adeliensis]